MGARGLTFLPTYVGQQRGGPENWSGNLTADQGAHDGNEAAALVTSYGWSAGTPVCLDLEGCTYRADPEGTRAYVGAWVQAVRGAGFRPGVYSNPDAFANALNQLTGAQRPDFVWVASWIRDGFDPNLSPTHIVGLDDRLWGDPGCRAWQYTGESKVHGLNVDISVVDVVAGAPA
jgi:GH25 family lysozyme M1 (1,4-beta-N-acetylmuramidase)